MILVVDTSLSACTVGIFDRERTLFAASEAMTRGHQERLPVMVEEAFAKAGIAPRDLTTIAVTLGPGSFTGLRVGLAFAKGLAVGLDIPLKGIGTLEALAFHPELKGRDRMAVIDGGRGQIYVQRVTGDTVSSPQAFTTDMSPPEVLTGPGAALLTAHYPDADVFTEGWPDATALRDRTLSGEPHDNVTPIYMREADAVVSTRGIIDTLQLKPA